MHDLPLVIFTVLSQLVIGALITLWWLDWKTGKVSRQSGLMISLILVIIGGISVFVSLFHLGHPFAAYRAILNIGVSWLSREVTFYGIFVGLSVLYLWFWYKEDVGKRSLIGGVSAAAGVFAIFSSAMIYVIPAIPAWNGMTTIISFFITSLLLGPLFVGAILAMRGEFVVPIAGVSALTILAGVIVIGIYISSLQGGLPEAVETARLLLGSSLFWLRFAAALIAFALLALAFKNRNMRTKGLYSIAFMILLLSEFIGRLQFYETAVHL
ncbi:DmsC/YnfH family molybdoenzyme membrane anchor subunit [Bacillus sp. FJAT-27251]|uniref:dimethyl sulfoxide reductase anchor subunit family protein n=1 Tax=Bacillus sp. FJAT-27251 TaxID=1684142 RepID=UPI0006A7C217|nr:DmsC/YnfH family molybdoenzyme membrane anchor subunit [Bacillus sp. FJAT-27251]